MISIKNNISGVILFIFFVAMLYFTACNSFSGEKKITFSEHIAPIIYSNCTSCHRPGEAGPFPLITYKDVKKKSKTIVKVTQSGVMPPWPADPEYQHYVGERMLNPEQKEL